MGNLPQRAKAVLQFLAGNPQSLKAIADHFKEPPEQTANLLATLVKAHPIRAEDDGRYGLSTLVIAPILSSAA